MFRDLEYWQDETTITIEPKTVKGRTVMVEKFPVYGVARQYKAYLANNGAMRWEFPVDSPVLASFLESQFCSVGQAVA